MVSEQAMTDSNDPNTTQSNTNTTQTRNTNSDPSHPSNPFYIGANDNSGSLLVPHTLDSNNYHSWARSMKRALRIKNKLGFIDGSICEPTAADSLLMEHWLRCNDIVITWLQNTMAPDIKRSTLYADTAYQLWKKLEQRFAQHNAPRVFEIKQNIANLICSCGGLKDVINNQQRDWVMKFLMGLNDSYKNLK
ncbi:uncharacterized protein LOC111380562, partial [Olea europaea var. sylvestris]|uniref:uncharacterized protein LOC111380562 n=1 Tax=Olea europaea var. sylvestris TaxID=158386 RepID=UPI000C1CD245